MNKIGKVYLVGAGPGDEGLLTVKAKKVIEQAEVLVYDRLVSDAIMALAPRDAELIYVGKAAANHAMKQEEINQCLADLAKAGKNVVRLKGGDPYVFGRGGEEGELLFDQGVPFEVIPGITSAIGGLCYGGIPITHRDLTSSFHVFTGHFKDEERDHDWENIAKLKGTKVFLMGVGNLEYIMEKTLGFGMSPDMPVAIISNATRGNQKVLTSTASRVVSEARAGEIKPPSLLVIGEVVSMREKLNWFEAMPLFGKTIAVTRAKLQNSKLASKLRDLGATVVELPAIRIEPKAASEFEYCYDSLLGNLPVGETDKKPYSWIIFTSENSVEIFMEGLFEKNLDGRAIGRTKIAVIGSGTEKKLNSYGLRADLKPKRFVAEGIIEAFEILAESGKGICENDHVLLPRASEARPLLHEWLKERCPVTEVHLYDTVLETNIEDETLEMLKIADYITFTSASTVHNFMKQLQANGMTMPEGLKTISIGPITTEAIKAEGLSTDLEAEVHDLNGLTEALIKAVREGL